MPKHNPTFYDHEDFLNKKFRINIPQHSALSRNPPPELSPEEMIIPDISPRRLQEESLRQQAHAWEAVADALTRIDPGWITRDPDVTAITAAVAFIQRLAANQKEN